jgi:hypothetical protein
MEAYRKIDKYEEPYPKNEIRVIRDVGAWLYLKRARKLLNDPEGSD